MNKYWLMGFVLMAIVLPGCREDEPAKPGNIRFGLSPTTVTDGHGRKAASLPEGALLFVSIRRVSGDEVYTLEPVRLLKLGDEYISEPLALPGGNYELTDFLVADSAGNTSFATPKEGSPLAPWVDDPLPQPFAVSDDAIARVDVQVLPTDAYEPGQFGYVTFAPEIVAVPNLRLSVFRMDESGPMFSRAHAYLLSGDDTVFHQYLPAAINEIPVDGDADRTYTLVVTEVSYGTYMRTFVLSELLAELNGAPLQVTLKDALTFTAIYRPDGNDFFIGTREESTAPLVINWGDGTEEVLPPLRPGTYTPKHMYAGPGRYHVSVVGDMQAVEYVSFMFTRLDDVSLRALPELRNFDIIDSKSPDSLDLSHNPKLVGLSLAYSDVRYFDIGNNPLIKYLILEGNVDFPVPVLDQVLTDLHDHAFEQQIYQGEINLRQNRRGGLIGPPSPAVMQLLYHLSELGWIVYD
jgi:hypothetical protein